MVTLAVWIFLIISNAAGWFLAARYGVRVVWLQRELDERRRRTLEGRP